MKQIRTSALLLLAVVLPAACTQEEITGLPGGGTDTGQVEIIPNATLQGSVEASSRAPINGATANTFYFKRADETAAGTYGAYSTAAFTATRVGGTWAQALTFVPLQYYLANGLKSKITGYYPAATSSNATQVQWTLNGTQDVMTAPRQEGSKTSRNITAFTFAHRLTQLRFFPYATSQNVADQWGKITRIELLNQPSGLSYSLSNDATGSVAATGATATFTVANVNNVAIYIAAAPTTLAGDPTLVLPQADANYTLQIKITTEKRGTITVTRKGALAAATPYNINLRFWGKGVEVEAVALTIADWVTTTKPDVPTSKTYPHVLNGKIIVFEDADGKTASGWIHPPWMSSTMPAGTDWTNQYNAVSKKMEIAPNTVNNTWNATWNTQTVCPDPWRMPTVWEAFAMRDLREYLTGVSAINTDLLTATSMYRPSDNAWYVPINSTGTGQNSAWIGVAKTTTMPIRCVKDLE